MPYLMSALIFTLILFSINHLSYCKGKSSFLAATEESPLKKNAESAKAWEVQKSFQDIYELYKDRVVFISTEQKIKTPPHPFFNDPFFQEFFGPQIPRSRTQKRTGLGTGFIVSEDGYICTNHHVIAGVDSITVKLNGKSFKARLIGSDERTDIALLKIEPGMKLKPVFMGNSDDVKVGDWAIAIGNPFGLDKTFTVGVISATGRRDVDMMGGSESHIQTDASINPGNSGGPLINIKGEVIGINRMIYSQSGGFIGIGFAIPVNTAKSILIQLKNHKKIKRGYIGVQIAPLSEDLAEQLGLKTTEGAVVGQVMDDGPADKGGLKPGDVILMVNDRIVKDISDLVNTINNTPIGKSVKITVWRAKAKLQIYIKIAERP